MARERSGAPLSGPEKRFLKPKVVIESPEKPAALVGRKQLRFKREIRGKEPYTMPLTRRAFLRLGAAGAAGLFAAGRGAPAVAAAAAGEASAARKPNFVFILADDLGYADVGCYGQQKIRTPCIDRLAAEGMRFTDVYAAPVCIPARCTLMTGLHLGHARLRANNHKPLLEEDVTIPKVLRAAGYVTGQVGKWALGDDPGGPGAPHRQGWDYYYGEPNQTIVHSYYLPHVWEFDRTGRTSGLPPDTAMRQVPLPGNAGGGRKQYLHDLLTEKALAFLDTCGRGPFLLYVAYTIPHAKYEAPDLGPYAAQAWPEGEKTYAAMVARMDADVGRLMQRLRDRGLDADTLVIFASDNGATGGSGHSATFFSSGGPLRALKGTLYEGGLRVPFIARWPGRVPAATTTDLPAAFYDVLPTLADLAGVRPPERIDGLSLAATLLGRPEKQPARDYLYWEAGDGRAVRMGSWKAVRPKEQAPIELYDLKADVGEKSDVAAAHPDVVARAAAYFKEAHTDDPLAGGGEKGKKKGAAAGAPPAPSRP